VYIANGIKQNYTSATFNNTATGVKVTGHTVGANLICWPQSVTLPAGV